MKGKRDETVCILEAAGADYIHGANNSVFSWRIIGQVITWSFLPFGVSSFVRNSSDERHGVAAQSTLAIWRSTARTFLQVRRAVQLPVDRDN